MCLTYNPCEGCLQNGLVIVPLENLCCLAVIYQCLIMLKRGLADTISIDTTVASTDVTGMDAALG